MSKVSQGCSADGSYLLDAGVRNPSMSPNVRSHDPMLQVDDVTPVSLPVEDISRDEISVNEPLKQQMTIAQIEMQRFHEAELHRYEGIVQALMQKINEMTQEDQGATIRIEDLERRRDLMKDAMARMNQVHHGSRLEFEVTVMKMDESSQARHARDHELAESLSYQLGQLRSEAATSYVHLRDKKCKVKE